MSDPVEHSPEAATADPQAELVACLRRPSFFGVDRVEFMETHAARVFLAGDRAYKLKKAVRFSYLDYGTPEARRRACEAELAVNRRFAPELYHGVVSAVRAADGSLRLGGEGVALDWLVVMRRFRSEDQLDQVAQRGELAPALVDALSDQIAATHAAAPVRPDHGGYQGVARALALTQENLGMAAGAVLPPEPVSAWTGRARAELERLAPLLEQRREAGKVRACHGDLHLQNICLVDGRPLLFDAIEFDEALSSIDVLYDLAFLLMDMHRRGLCMAANRLFNRYLDQRDETAGLPAMPLFLSVRAAIRAQVRAAAALQARGTAGEGGIAAEARGFLDLALSLIEPEPPSLVAVGGFSGSGKSTLARGLAPLIGPAPGARLLRTDVLRKRAAGVEDTAPLPEAAYREAARATVYRQALDAAQACLGAGCSVVLDAVFDDPERRSEVEARARALGIRFVGLWLTASPAVLEARLAARVGDASDATIKVLRAQLDRGGPPVTWRPLDAGREAGRVLEQARGILAAGESVSPQHAASAF